MNRLLSSLVGRALAALGLTLIALSAAAQPAASTAATTRPVHRFTTVTDGIYGAISTGAMNVGSNTGIIVNERDVLIVDSHITPASARALLKEIPSLTDKPVRFVVNTHFHFDHAHGNQIFPDDVLIIGHEFTRDKLAGDPLNEPSYRSFTGPVPQQVETLRSQVAAETDAAKKKELADRLDVLSAYAEALKEVRPLAPNVTLRTKMTLFRAGREIQLLFFGRGHTGGDVVVYLPKEKVVCTGDLFTGSVGFMGDGYLDEWVQALEELKKLDFEAVIPGHGEVITGGALAKQRIGFVQAYFRELWAKANDLKAQGVPADEAAKRIDMTAHKVNFAQITGPGADPRAVNRIYQVIDERARK